MQGNVVDTITRDIAQVGHFHSAAVPGRGEHFDGELHYPRILRAIDATGYKGRFGLEYFPKMEDHSVSLQRVRQYLRG
jgi:hydroxypyruvate isomerase